MLVATPAHSRLIGSLLVLLGALGFSSKAVLVKLAYGSSPQLDAITLMTLRMLFALPFFLLVAGWLQGRHQETRLTINDGLLIAGLGVLGFYLSGLLDFSGLAYISAGLERLILFLYPTLVVLFSALCYRRPIQRRERLALLVSYAGIGVVFSGQMTGNSPRLMLGAGLVFTAAVTFALYLMISGQVVRRVGSLRFTAYAMSVACLASVLHFAASHELAALALPAKVYGLALLMALLATVIPAFLMNAGIQHLGAGPAAIIGSTGPVATLLLAWLLLGETLTMLQLAGTALILGGVLINNRKR
ncbi:MAG: DMT family transporter [Gammaproteobacteria bacterium]